jgi:L-iditol 2-dehydrogenase
LTSAVRLQTVVLVKALQLVAPSTFEFGDFPSPDLVAGSVRVDIKACGICGSDIHGMDGRSGRRIAPIIMGHEASGVISQVAPDVEGWEVGDRVTFDSTEFCGSCHECLQGNGNLCMDRRVLGVSCDAYRRHGCFAEQVVLPARILHRLPDALDFDRAAFAEPVAIALHAVNLGPGEPEGPAVVVGAGLIGLLVVQALRVRGWTEIIAVDLDAARLKLANQLGATAVFHANQADLATRLRAHCGGDGAAVCFEVVGASAPVDLAVRSARKGGTVVLVGNLQPSVALPLQEVVTRQITLRGSCACAGEYPEAIQRICDGSIQVAPLMSACVPLEQGGEWFARLAGNQEGLLKVILNP